MGCGLDAIPTNLNEEELNEWLTREAEESLADPRPSIPAAEVFRELRTIHNEATRNANGTEVE